MSNGDKHTIMLDYEPDRKTMSEQKWLAKIDNLWINMSYCASLEEISPKKETANTALARAQQLEWPLWAVAMERVIKYRSNTKNGGIDITLSKLMDWMTAFQKDPELYPEYYKLYQSVWGDGSDLFT